MTDRGQSMKPHTEQEADRAFDVLVAECGASERQRAEFVHTVGKWLHDLTWSEYRFQGALGFGGKLYTTREGMRVACYPEDDTPERRAMIERANVRLDPAYVDPEPTTQ